MTSQQCFFYLKLYKAYILPKETVGSQNIVGNIYILYIILLRFFGSHLYTKYYTLQGLKKNQIYFPDYFMLILCSDYHCLPLFVMNVHIYTCTWTSRIATCNEKRDTLHSFRRCYLVVSRFQSD